MLRPDGTIGIAVGGNLNWSLVLATYAALCAEAGEALQTPLGSSALIEIADSVLIAQASAWAAVTPIARNEVYNITNGDIFAEALGIETTAEGIETHDQLELIKRLRVSHIQGCSILIRNLSDSGALVEGLQSASVGTRVLIDLGSGQICMATVRRVVRQQRGIEFEQALVSDGNGGGLCSRPSRLCSFDEVGRLTNFRGPTWICRAPASSGRMSHIRSMDRVLCTLYDIRYDALPHLGHVIFGVQSCLR